MNSKTKERPAQKSGQAGQSRFPAQLDSTGSLRVDVDAVLDSKSLADQLEAINSLIEHK